MSASDVKVWDAPSIGRNDGMSVETKCYQHVVIWADYAKALMKVEDERDEANRVCEQWRQWTVAARADNEALRARVAELEGFLRDAHGHLYDYCDENEQAGFRTIATAVAELLTKIEAAMRLSGNKSGSLE